MERRGGHRSLPPVTGNDSAAAIEDAVASAAALMLRHRLFPRAMAWNIQQSVERVAEPAGPSPTSAYARAGNETTAVELPARFPPHQTARPSHVAAPDGSLTAAQLVMAAANDADKMTLEDVARSFPLLQAVDGSARALNRSSFSSSESSGSLDQDGDAHHHRREKLLRTVGKFLGDGESVPRAGGAQSSASMYQMQGVVPMTINRVPVDEDQQHAAFRAMKISTYSDDESASDMTEAAAVQAHHQHGRPAVRSVPTPTTSPLPPRARSGSNAGRHTVQARPRSPATPSSVSSASSSTRASVSKKRARGGDSTRRERERVDPVTMQFPKTKTPIAPSLARALLTGYGAKRCSVDECGKIAVSKGLCRGHGGGRRCQSAGCNKCAQSRSPFCWAHGGGKRCEAPGCRRSRKTKRFCVDHVEMETTVPLPPSSAPSTPPRPSSSVSPSSASSQIAFPPLKRQMSADFASHTAAGVDSDDSVGGRSTITTDSDMSSAYTGSFSASNKENARGANAAASSMIVDEDGSSRQSKQFSSTQQPMHSHGYHHYQDAGERTGAFSPVVGLHGGSARMASIPPLAGPRGVALPSLSEALLRTVPAKPQADPRFPSASPSSSSVYASFASSSMVFSQAEDNAPIFPLRERPW